MKTLIFLATLLLSTSLLAFDICSFEETSQVNLKVMKTSKSLKKFTFAEKNLVHRTISLQNFYEGVSRTEAMELFGDESSDGEILYYQVDGKKLALVHYYPGDNEFGGYYLIKESGAAKLIATVGDSFISCIKE